MIRFTSRAALLAAFVGAMFAAAPAALAKVPTDCPLRTLPFSADGPLIDIMLSPQAKAVLNKEVPGLAEKLPDRFATTVTPSFASIMTLRYVGGMVGLKPDQTARIDSALKALPVTPADQAARCARYDDDRPNIVMPRGKLRVLLFEKMTGFRDGPSVEAARAGFQGIAARNGWAIVTTDKGGAINPAVLSKVDVIVWNNVSGDSLTLSQRRALQNYLARGGGFVAVHGSGGDPAYFWDWYVDKLIGARFMSHPADPQFQDAKVSIVDPGSSIAAGLPASWVMKDEWYSFKTNPRADGAKVIATLDESTYKPVGRGGTDLRMGADHPIAWRKCIGNGRAFYSAIGHMPQTYSEPHYVKMLEQAIAWAGGQGDTRCQAGKEVAQAKR